MQITIPMNNHNVRLFPRFSQSMVLVFFLSMLTMPTSNQFERGIALAILLAGSTAFLTKWRIDKPILVWLLITTIAGLIFLFIGSQKNVDRAFSHSTVFLIWPLVYVYLIGFAIKPATLVLFLKAIIIGILVSSLMGIIYVATVFIGFDLLYNFFENQGARAGFHDGYIQYRLFNITTLIYGVGFLFSIIASSYKSSWVTHRWQLIIYATIAFMIVAAILTGRRSLWLMIFVAPILHILLSLLSRQKISVVPLLLFFSTGLALLLIIAMIFDLEILRMADLFMSSSDFSGNVSNAARAEQYASLLAGWADNPWLGNGLGTSASILRGDDLPWAYELFYVSLLFHTGILGVMIYVLAILWLFGTGIRIMISNLQSQSILLPLLTALGCFLIASASNPYISTFDMLWTIFLPLAAINSFRVKNNHCSMTQSSFANNTFATS